MDREMKTPHGAQPDQEALLCRIAELEASNAQLHSLFQTMAQGVVYQSSDGAIFLANPAAERILGLSFDQMQGRTSVDPRWRSIHPDGSDFPGMEHPAIVALRLGQPVRDVVMGVYHPLEERYGWILVNAMPEFRPGESQPYQVYTTFVDITDRLEAERSLAESEKRYRDLFVNIQEGFIFCEMIYQDEKPVDFLHLSVNESFHRLTGLQDAVGKRATELVPGVDRVDPALIEIYDRVARTGKTERQELYLKSMGIWIDLSVYSFKRNTFVAIFDNITARKNSEADLRVSEERFRILISSLDEIVYTIDPNQIVTGVYGRWRLGFELDVAEVIGQPLEALFGGQAAALHEDANRRALAGEHVVYEWEFVSSGVGSMIQISLAPICGPGGDIQGVLAVGRNITARYMAELALTASEEKYRSLLESVGSELTVLDGEGQLLYVNEAAARSLGSTSDQLVGQLLTNLYPGAEGEQRLEWILSAIRENRGLVVETLSFVGGQLRWYTNQVQPIHNEQGQAYQAIINSTDIHPIKEAQRQLEEINQLLDQRVRERTAEVQDLYDNAPCGYMSFDLSGKLLMVNRTEQNWLGYSAEEMLCLSLFDIQPRQSWEAFEANLAKAATEGSIQDLEIDLVRKDGSLLAVMLNAATVVDSSGQVREIRGTVTDNTARKIASQALLESEQFNRLLFDESPDAAVLVDMDGKIVRANRVCEELTGRTAEELIGRTADESQLLPPDRRQWFRQAVVEGFNLGANGVSLNFAVMRRDGSSRHVESRSYQIWSGERSYVMTTLRDVTDRKVAEEAVRASELRLNFLLSKTPAMLFTSKISAGMSLAFISDSVRDLMGYEPNQFYSDKPDFYFNLMHPEDVGANKAALPILLKEGSATWEFRMKLANGSYHWFSTGVRAVLDANQVPVEVVGYLIDIDSQKKAQDALRLSEARLRSVFENVPAAIVEIDRDGNVLTQSRGLPELLAPEAINRPILEQIPEVLLGKINDQIEAVFESGSGVKFETHHAEPGGDTLDLISFIGPVWDGPQVKSAVSVTLDISDLKRAEAELQMQRDFARQVMDALGQGLVVCDLAGQVEYVNPSMAQQLGRQQAGLIGTPVAEFVHPEDRERLYDHLQGRASEANSQDEFRMTGVDGGLRYYLITSTPRRRDGQMVGSIALFTDLTETKEIELRLRRNKDELSAANTSLEKAARMKDEFLASMSHELRTPLTGILGLSEAMLLGTYGDLTERQIKALSNIESSGRHLLDLINDILDLSKIEAGRFDLQIGRSSVGEICQACLYLMREIAEQKKQKVLFSMTPKSIALMADGRRLKQMLINLLGNAVKYTREGGTIGLDVVGDAVNGVVRFSVWDTGIGIKMEDLPRLFQPFVQLDSSLARQQAGTGLGLSLVHRMTELHGGRMEVQSVPEQGSTFTIVLPWGDERLPSGRDTSAERSFLARRHPETDSLANISYLSQYLSALKIEHLVYPSARGAASKASRFHPGLILLDYDLPERGAVDVLNELRANPKTRAVPVLLLTREEDLPLAWSFGTAGYLTKPCTQTDLAVELNRLKTSGVDPSPVLMVAARNAPARILVLDDNEMILELVSSYLETAGFEVVNARSGVGALQMANELYPDLIMVDIQMPGMDGLEVIRRLRAHPDALLARVGILAVTALAMPGDRERCLEAGADGYLSKPIQMASLTEAIADLLARNARASH